MTDLIGRTLGQYQIIEKIGEGGMAAVYKAYQPGLDRYVAVKVLPPLHAKQPGFSQRFQREAKAIANLHHQNILPVYDSGQEGDYSFIVMRYVEGARTLKEVMQTPLSLSQVVDLIGQIASALDYAHRQGVVHRDVKPANVLMDGDWALLTDFGLAKMTEASIALTGTGVGIGTPAYMSPEQGQGLHVDHRTDIYSLGIILFEMVTGRIPHNAETPIAIIFKRATEPLPPPRTLNPNVPESVERVILKALAREPGDRFASTGEMAAVLKGAVSEADAETLKAPLPVAEEWATAPVPDTPPSTQAERTPTTISAPPKGALPWKWIAAVAGLSIIVVGLIIALISKGGPGPEPTATLVAAVPVATPTTAPPDTLIPVPPTSTPLPSTSTHTPVPTHTLAPTNTSVPTSTPVPEPTDTPFVEPTTTPLAAPTSTPTEKAEEAMAGKVVTVLGPNEGWMTEQFDGAMAPFEARTGIKVEYEPSDDVVPLIFDRVGRGDPPDLAALPGPGWLGDLVHLGYVVDLNEFLDEAYLKQQYAQSWLDMVTVDGQMSGVWYGVTSIKSLVWYPVPEFEQAGYQVPQTWDERIALSDRMAADGRIPWCIGIESGYASGWVATDWIEDIMLRTTSPQNYDKWIRGELKFNSLEVRRAVEIMGQIWLKPGYVYGGASSISTTFFGDSPIPLSDTPPSCWLHRQASFIAGFFPEGTEVGRDVNYFYLPPIDPAYGKPVLATGYIFAMFNDRPEVRELVKYLTTGESMMPLIEAGSALSPHKDADLNWYPTATERGYAEILMNADTVRFDGSDMMPDVVGAGSFWSEMVDYVNGKDLDAVLGDIDSTWP
jgi:alpha-glucoside transport system substrate-binding protein